jgi:hypothetical protein
MSKPYIPETYIRSALFGRVFFMNEDNMFTYCVINNDGSIEWEKQHEVILAGMDETEADQLDFVRDCLDEIAE